MFLVSLHVLLIRQQVAELSQQHLRHNLLEGDTRIRMHAWHLRVVVLCGSAVYVSVDAAKEDHFVISGVDVDAKFQVITGLLTRKSEIFEALK